MLINKIVSLSYNQEKAKEIQERVQRKRETGEDYRTFGEVLQEELDKIKATKDTAKQSKIADWWIQVNYKSLGGICKWKQIIKLVAKEMDKLVINL